ncbi:hypothetical protein GCM10009680_84850 [Streptomyces yatensis]|uniref:AB hydrolase-1 domain-containing protein n=1 Tax=Streptomyces yatensis TaxID=155177 RepID=A0ABN2JL36_9ACTN
MADLHHLLDRLRVDAAHLVAAAGGGPIALEYSLLHPERVTSLVLSGTVGGLADADYLEEQARCVTPELGSLPWHLRNCRPDTARFTPKESGGGRRFGPPRTKSENSPSGVGHARRSLLPGWPASPRPSCCSSVWPTC